MSLLPGQKMFSLPGHCLPEKLGAFFIYTEPEIVSPLKVKDVCLGDQALGPGTCAPLVALPRIVAMCGIHPS